MGGPEVALTSVPDWTLTTWEDRLLSDRGAPSTFCHGELQGLPEPVQRHLDRAIAEGTVISPGVRLTMRGRLKLGLWLPFRADQVLNPHAGFIWRARVAGLIRGSDCFVDGRGAMGWRLAGLVGIAGVQGPDVSRSAAGRAVAEAIWAPMALLPRFGVEWSAADDTHVRAHLEGPDGRPLDLELSLHPDGRIATVRFDRWGDPDRTGAWAEHSFGGDITAYRTFGGLSIPSAGRLGWGFGTPAWPTGEFFRFEIRTVRLLGGTADGARNPAVRAHDGLTR